MDADARTIMQMVMDYQGALVIPADSAKAALALMATVKPNVLVSDINMPQHDGFWVAQRGATARIPGRSACRDGAPAQGKRDQESRIRRLPPQASRSRHSLRHGAKARAGSNAGGVKRGDRRGVSEFQSGGPNRRTLVTVRYCAPWTVAGASGISCLPMSQNTYLGASRSLLSARKRHGGSANDKRKI